MNPLLQCIYTELSWRRHKISNSYLSLLFKTTVYIQAISLGNTFHTKSEKQQLTAGLRPSCSGGSPGTRNSYPSSPSHAEHQLQLRTDRLAALQGLDRRGEKLETFKTASWMLSRARWMDRRGLSA